MGVREEFRGGYGVLFVCVSFCFGRERIVRYKIGLGRFVLFFCYFFVLGMVYLVFIFIVSCNRFASSCFSVFSCCKLRKDRWVK